MQTENSIYLFEPPTPYLIESYYVPNWGLLYLREFMRSKGLECDLIEVKDLNILNQENHVWGIGACTPQFPNAIKLAKHIQKNNQFAYVAIGGPHVTAVPNDGVKECFDLAILGEGEAQFYNHISEENLQTDSLDDYPFPRIAPHEIDFYGQYRKLKAINVVTSRGCNWNCLPKGTLVLMEDMKQKPIEEVRCGDRVIGAYKKGRWRYTIGTVLNTFNREAEVYAIETEDGTAYSTIEHPWLMKERFKSIEDVLNSAKYNGKISSTRNSLRKLYSPMESIPETEDYKWGYLAGTADGDGCFSINDCKRSYGHYKYLRYGIVGDYEMLDKVYLYSEQLGIKMREEKFNGGKLYKCNRRIALTKHKEAEKLQNILNTHKETGEFIRGYLAGIYDAEGSWSNNVLRIAQNDGNIKNRIKKYLKLFDFNVSHEKKSIRLLGGVSEHIRFISWCSPHVIKKGNIIKNQQVKNCSRIKNIYKIGKQEVYNLETTINTFVADGFITHNCSFCANEALWGRGTRYHSVDYVKEMLSYYKKIGFETIRFCDDSFTLDKKRMLSIVQHVHSLGLKWQCQSRAEELLDKERLEIMNKFGCTETAVGIESGDQQILDRCNKKTTVDKMRRGLIKADKFGINVRAYILLGLPGETSETLEKTKKFIDTVPATAYTVSTFVPYPGTEIANKPDKFGIHYPIRKWNKYVGIGNKVSQPSIIKEMKPLQSKFEEIAKSVIDKSTFGKSLKSIEQDVT